MADSIVWIREGEAMSEGKQSWGGKRTGAGRKPAPPPRDGSERRIRSIKVGDEEWLLIKAFEKLVKSDPERAKRLLETE